MKNALNKIVEFVKLIDTSKSAHIAIMFMTASTLLGIGIGLNIIATTALVFAAGALFTTVGISGMLLAFVLALITTAPQSL